MPLSWQQGACAYIDQHAIAHNLLTLRHRIRLEKPERNPRIWAVVKADAYGHGLSQTLPALQAADGLAVLSVADAYRCRQLGWIKQILIMGGQLSLAELNDPILYPLHVVAEHAGQVEQLEQLTGACRPHAWLRFTGSLHHAGFQARDYRPAYARLQALFSAKRLAGIGHFQHYANAEDPELLAADRQSFAQLTAGLPGQVSTENSAALLTSTQAAASTDWLRIGLALYGASPLTDKDGDALGLQPAMTLQAPIYGIQELQAGDSIGYGSMFRAERAMRIGLVHCGYADGYPGMASNDCHVQLASGMTSIIGRVSMDTLAIDLSAHPDIGPGHQAILWGSHELPVEKVALAAGTIAAQLLTGLTARVPRLAAYPG